MMEHKLEPAPVVDWKIQCHHMSERLHEVEARNEHLEGVIVTMTARLRMLVEEGS